MPPAFTAGGFDCGEQELSDYLCDGTARRDQEAGMARTYLVRSSGELIGYFSVLADAIRLDTRERPEGCCYSSAPSLKLGRMGVSKDKQGSGVGFWILDYIVGMARAMSSQVGIRYVTLDALKKPTLVAWYKRYGFVENRGHEKGLARLLRLRSRDELSHVSMRFDVLLEEEIAAGSENA